MLVVLTSAADLLSKYALTLVGYKRANNNGNVYLAPSYNISFYDVKIHASRLFVTMAHIVQTFY